MSATYIIRFRDCPVRFTFLAGRSVYEVTTVERATPFTNESDAWLAARRHHLASEHLTVEKLARRHPAAMTEASR